MVSINREDKIKFVKDGMNKESFDENLRSLKIHSIGYVQRDSKFVEVVPKGKCTVLSWESDSIRPCLPVYKKNGCEVYPRPIEGVQVVTRPKTRERCEPQLQLSVNILLFYCSFIFYIIIIIVCHFYI